MAKQGKKAGPGTKKILILAANPRDTDPLRLDREVREIDEGLRRSKHRDQFELVQRWAVRIQDLRRALLDEEPQIVHFCGHGANQNKLSGEKNRRHTPYESKDYPDSGIVLEDEQDRSTIVSKEALAELLGILAEGIECVVLNACYSEVQAEALGEYIPYVIGMRKAIGDKAAIEFSTGFYDGLGAGKSVMEAFQLGCNAIHLKDIPEHLTPVIKKQSGAPDFSLQPAPESTLKKVALWLGIIATVGTIITFALDIPGKIKEAYESVVPVANSCMFNGRIVDRNGAPVVGAEILVQGKKGAGFSDDNGEFNFEVKEKAGTRVQVLVKKNGVIRKNTLETLPGPITIALTDLP